MPKEKKTDPVCGMKGHIFKHDHYFCSQSCIEKYEEQHGLRPKKIQPWQKSLLYVVVVLAAILLVIFLQMKGWMIPFMGGFFIVVSILKFLDWKGFAKAFAMYDIVAKRSKPYAYVYPVIEFALGLAFLFSFQIIAAAWVTFAVMSIGTVGVAGNLFSKNPVKCACLGTLIKVPLTRFTLFEDVLMAVMALMVIFL